MTRTLHLLVEGRVQGVGFRAWVEREAARRGLAGWVRNLRTGAVELTIAGTAAGVEGMATACSQGPPAAKVAAVYRIADVVDLSLGTFVGFEVRPTV
jgi:acylphosphatase